MAEPQHDSVRSDQSPVAVTGRFADPRSAERAAQAALRNGFTVQCVDNTVTVRTDRAEDVAEAELLIGTHGPTNLPEVHAERGHTPPAVAGSVLIHKRVVQDTVTVQVPVEREELVIERVLPPSRIDDWA